MIEQGGPGAEAGPARETPPAGGDLRVIAVLGAFQIGVMLANLVRVKIVALESGPAGLGLITLIEQIVLAAALACTLSLPFAAVKFLSLAHSRSQGSFVRAYIAFRRALSGLSLVGFAAALMIAFAAPGIFGAEVRANREVLLVAVAAIPLLNLLALLTRALAASGRSRAAAGMTLAQWSGLAVGAGTGVILDGLRGYFVGGVIATLPVLLGGTVYLRRLERTSEHRKRLHTVSELRLYPGVLRFTLVYSLIWLTTPFAFLVARYAVLADAGLEEVGLLAAAFGISQALTMLLTPAIALFLTPAVNRGDAPHVKLERTLQFRRSMLFAIGAAMLPLLLFPRTLLEVLFAAEFTPVASYVYLFVLGEALGLLSGVHQALLIGLDDFGVNVAYIVAGQVLITGLVVVLVPAFGIAGVGIALIADHALVLALTTWRLWRRHGMAMLDGLRPFVPAAIGVAAVGAVVPSLPEGGPAVLAAKIAVLAALVALGVVLYRATSPVEQRT
jgi:O-antigen/teichoic acid export membrane protein